MNECKPTAGFWATVAAAVILALYPLSIGPTHWIDARCETGGHAIGLIYKPVYWLVYVHPKFGDFLEWYCCVGAGGKTPIMIGDRMVWLPTDDPNEDGTGTWSLEPKRQVSH